METMMTVGEVARKLGLTEAAIRSHILNRKIPFRKVGAAVRFKESEIEEWINNGCPAGVKKVPEPVQRPPDGNTGNELFPVSGDGGPNDGH